ncbi:hypothetical protein ACHAWF_010885 [Thalassiosira exigua]
MSNTSVETSSPGNRRNKKLRLAAAGVVLVAAVTGGICGSGNCGGNGNQLQESSSSSGESFTSTTFGDETASRAPKPKPSPFPAAVTRQSPPLPTSSPVISFAPNGMPHSTPRPTHTSPAPTPPLPYLAPGPFIDPVLSTRPSEGPMQETTSEPTGGLSREPTRGPSKEPIRGPSRRPSEGPTGEPTREPSATPTQRPTPKVATLFDGESGAIVTTDCLFLDYGYAIDIYWSCGSERFGNPLRLHTFKRHSRGHGLVFADQKITHRDGILWFEEYDTPRCISVRGGDLVLRTSASQCDEFILEGSEGGFEIRQAVTGDCVTLGTSPFGDCNDDRSTGGSECGGVDHRFLPLGMGSCDRALEFRFERRAEDCTNGADEYPSPDCFFR